MTDEKARENFLKYGNPDGKGSFAVGIALPNFLQKEEYQIQLDPIYTGKMIYGIFDLIDKGFFSKGSKIVAIHTGGLQGILGFRERFGNLI